MVLAGIAACGQPSPSKFHGKVVNLSGTVSPNNTSSTLSTDASCTAADLHLWSQLHFTGDQLCFFGEGTADLIDYPLPSGMSQSWVGQVRGLQVGIAPAFLNGQYQFGESYSTPYPVGFSDDEGSDLPPNIQSITLANPAGGSCSGNCGYVSDGSGHTVACGPLGGACPAAAQTCLNNSCCTPDNSTICANRDCGFRVNNCGQTVNCGILGICLQPGTQCTSEGRCCKTKTNACSAYQCGTVDDGCGNQYTCGTCETGTKCSVHTCVITGCHKVCSPPKRLDPETCTCIIVQ